MKKYTYLIGLFIIVSACGDPVTDEHDESLVDSTLTLPEGIDESITADLNRDKKKKVPPVKKPNFLMVHRGRLYNDDDNIPKGVYRTTEEDITESLDAWQDSGNPMFLYCHGGLVPSRGAFTKPNRTVLDSTLRAHELFPYYLIYDAGIGAMTELKVEEMDRKIQQGLTEIKEDGIFKFIKKKIKKLIARKSYEKNTEELILENKNLEMYAVQFDMTEEGIPDDIFIDFVEWDNPQLFFTPEELIAMEDQLAEEFVKEYQGSVIKSDMFLSEMYLEEKAIDKAQMKFEFKEILKQIKFVRILTGVLMRFKEKRDHGVLLTVFEEWFIHGQFKILGKMVDIQKWIRKYVQLVWDMSKLNVEMAFDNEPESAGTNFLNRLEGMTGDVVLCGSSTGAIYVCEFIKKMKKIKAARPEAFEGLNLKIILVVSATKFTLFQETFENTENLFAREDVLLLSLSDKMELSGLNLAGVGWPIGSTLYFVSAIAEKSDDFHDLPIVGMERYYIEKGNLGMLSDSDSVAIDYAYDYIGYGTDFPKMVISYEKHPTATYLYHEGTRHVNLMKDPSGVQSMAEFARYGYFKDHDMLADEGGD